MKRGLGLALSIGACWGLVETIVSYGLGTAPMVDVLMILSGPLAVCLLCYAPLIVLARFKPGRLVDSLMSLGVLIPLVVFTARSPVGLASTHALMGVLPATLGLILVAIAIRRGRPLDSHGTLSLGILYALYAWAVLACALRGDPNRAITSAHLLHVLVVDTIAGLSLLVAARTFRMRAPFSTAFIALVCAVGVAALEGSGPPRFSNRDPVPISLGKPETRPNVILIVMDTVRADHLDLYGHSRPTFARTSAFLKDGLVLDRATANGTFSLTSHGSLFTGLLPTAHGAYPLFRGEASFGRVFNDVKTLAETLRESGYITLGLSANDVFLAEWTGLQRGFDQFLADGRRRFQFRPFTIRMHNRLTRGRGASRPRTSDTWKASEVTDAAIDVIDRSGHPYFLFLNYFDAHAPHELIDAPAWLPQGSTQPSDLYDSEIAFIDREIARLLTSLKERGDLDRTLVIVTADHGEYFGERTRLVGHPAAPFEQGLHVPLALRLPGVVPAGRSDRRTGLHEMFRLVDDVVNGRSVGWLSEPDLRARIITDIWSRSSLVRAGHPDGQPTTTVAFIGNLKLIHRLSGVHELYDLAVDPSEKVNLIQTSDARIAGLRDLMLNEVALRKKSRAAGAAEPLSEEAKEKMRALGYIR